MFHQLFISNSPNGPEINRLKRATWRLDPGRRRDGARTHHSRRQACPSSTSSLPLPASETEEGNTKHIAQKKFLSKGVTAKSGEDILLIGIKTTEKVVKEGNTHFGRVFSDKL